MSRGDEPESASDDPILHLEAQRALQPYLRLIPATELNAFRELVRWHLATDPVAVRLLKAVRASRMVNESGDVDATTGEPVEPREAAQPKGGKR